MYEQHRCAIWGCMYEQQMKLELDSAKSHFGKQSVSADLVSYACMSRQDDPKELFTCVCF